MKKSDVFGKIQIAKSRDWAEIESKSRLKSMGHGIAHDSFKLRSVLTVFIFLSFAVPSWAGVCERSPKVARLLSLEVGKTCETVTLEDLSKIESLDFSEESLGELWIGDFSGLSHLQELSLGLNELKVLAPQIFLGLKELKLLELNNNKLKSLPEGIFNDQSELKELYLGGNPLAALPVGIFDKLTKLEVLKFARTKLQSLPNNLFSSLGQLRELNLNGNELVPGTLSQLPNLETLELFLQDTSSEVGPLLSGLTKLKFLMLGDQRVDQIGTYQIDADTLAGLTQLSGLGLIQLKNSEIPEDFFKHTPNLMSLQIVKSNLQKIPKSVLTGIKNLQVIGLQRNEFLKFEPKAFSDLKNLTLLFLDEYTLDSEVLNGIDQVQAIAIEFSKKATSFPSAPFANMPALLELQINSKNAAASNLVMPPNFFKGLRSVNQLSVFYISINELPTGLFDELVNVKRLSFSHNQTFNLAPNLLNNLVNLEKVEFYNNNLQSIPEKFFQGLPHLKTIDLRENDFSDEEKARIKSELPAGIEIDI